jgi:hypothetical protein
VREQLPQDWAQTQNNLSYHALGSSGSDWRVTGREASGPGGERSGGAAAAEGYFSFNSFSAIAYHE